MSLDSATAIEGLTTNLMGDILRQHAGLDAKIDEKPIGHHEEMGNTTKSLLGTVDVDNSSQVKTLVDLGLWMDTGDWFLNDIDLSTVPPSNTGELTILGLAKIREKLLSENEQLVKNGVIPQEIAISEVTKSRSIELIDNLVRVQQIITTIDNIPPDQASPLARDNMVEIRDFLASQLTPDQLEIVGKTSNPEYSERLTKLFDKPNPERIKRAQDLISSMAENNIKKESFVMYEEILEIAAIRNFGMLCEKAKEYGVDIDSLRDQIKSLEGQERDPEKIVQILSPLAKFFSDQEVFPHNNAYLLSHVIKNGQAVCASRTIMFGMFLKNFGLSPEFGMVSVHNNNQLLTNHTTTHLSVGDHEIEWDFNYKARDPWQKQNGDCLINILEKNDGEYDIPSREDLLKQSQSEYVYSHGKLAKFRLVKGTMPHKVVFKSKIPMIDHHHFILNITNEEFFKQLSRDDQKLMREYAVNILSNEIKHNGASGYSYDALATQYRQKAKDSMANSEPRVTQDMFSQSASTYEQAIAIEPYNYHYHRNYGVLLFDPLYLALLDSDNKIINIRKALPHLRYFIDNTPDDTENLNFKKWCQTTVEKFAFVEEQIPNPSEVR